MVARREHGARGGRAECAESAHSAQSARRAHGERAERAESWPRLVALSSCKPGAYDVGGWQSTCLTTSTRVGVPWVREVDSDRALPCRPMPMYIMAGSCPGVRVGYFYQYYLDAGGVNIG